MNLLYFLANADLEKQISTMAVKTVTIGAAVLIIFTIIAALLKNRYKVLRLPFFIIMASALVIPTIVLFGSTVYLNTHADSKGPVHWHADIEFWSCGAELNLRDPTGALSNKIGSPTFHEHNDKRMHLEGVVVKKGEDASLKKFMGLTGGYLTKDSIAIPLNKDTSNNPAQAWFASEANNQVDGDIQSSENFPAAVGFGSSDGKDWIENTKDGPLLVLKNGEKCGNSPAPAELQVFVYSFNKKNNTYLQKKLTDPTSYNMRDEATVPPGDCVIVEYDVAKSLTDKLCRQYGVRDKKRCAQFGVEPYNPNLCEIEQVPPLGGAL